MNGFKQLVLNDERAEADLEFSKKVEKVQKKIKKGMMKKLDSL